MSSAAEAASAPAGLRRALEDAGVDTGADPAAYALAGAVPLAVALPKTVEDVSAALAAASRLNAAVVPWGGGTRQGLGHPPVRYHLALDLRALTRLVAHEPADLTVTVQAGSAIGALQGALAEAGQWLPLDPPLVDRATVGGALATGLAGPLGMGYGLPREMVIGMRAVLADGAVVKSGGNVVKNVTGFAMDRLYTGSLGTLAVIVEATFKILPIPRAEATLAAAFASAEEAAAACAEVSALGLPTLAVEVLNNAAWTHVSADGPVPPSTGPGRTEHSDGWRLLARVAGRASAVTRSVDAWAAACRAHGAASVEAVEGESSGALWSRVADLGWESGGPGLAVRAAVPPSQGVAALAALAEASSPVAALSVTRGVARAAWDADALPRDPAAYVAALRERAASLGGTVVAESRAPIEGLDPWGPPSDGFAVMQGLKTQYDPKGILNPGRFLGGI